MIRTERLTGSALLSALDDLAALRIEVFRAFPYLYDGDLDYERRYLETYRQSDDAILIAALDGARLVGASTGTPMVQHADDFATALAHQAVPLERIFYCAESVLLPGYRGQGVGHAFFDAREEHARRLGLTHSAFCAVMRPADHPLRPHDYAPLDPFWRKRGYAPVEAAVASYSWKDVDQAQETDHPLQFWMRAL